MKSEPTHNPKMSTDDPLAALTSHLLEHTPFSRDVCDLICCYMHPLIGSKWTDELWDSVLTVYTVEQARFGFYVKMTTTRSLGFYVLNMDPDLCFPVCNVTARQCGFTHKRKLIEIQKDEAVSIETIDTSLQTTASSQSESGKTR